MRKGRRASCPNALARPRPPARAPRPRARRRQARGRAQGRPSPKGGRRGSYGAPSASGHNFNSGCLPGTDTGTGEGLSALFVHPDEDVYDLAEGGGILSEPPRTFEALAFAPRMPEDGEETHEMRAGVAAQRRRKKLSAGDELLATFASAAALGAHRTPPRVIAGAAAGAAGSSAEASMWQMWASEDLTDAIGVPLLPADGAPAEAPAAAPAEAALGAAGAAGKAKKEAEEGKGKGREGVAPGRAGSPSNMLPSGEVVKGIKDFEGEEAFRKMHINYRGVLTPGAAAKGKAKGGKDGNDDGGDEATSRCWAFKRSGSPRAGGAAAKAVAAVGSSAKALSSQKRPQQVSL